MSKFYEGCSTEQLQDELGKSRAEIKWFPGDIALKVRHELALETEIVRRYIAKNDNNGTGPHFCYPACYDTHATELDRAGDEAECCQIDEHYDRYDDSTDEAVAAHVVAHLAMRRAPAKVSA